MKSLLHCHLKNLHSIILGHDNDGNVVRLFIADEGHTLNKNNIGYINMCMQQLTMHDHNSDITIYPVSGRVHNISLTKGGKFVCTNLKGYQYVSNIRTGKGQFIDKQINRVVGLKNQIIREPLFIPHDELHTVYVDTPTASWIVAEGKPLDKQNQIAWSTNDLSTWTDDGLYIPMSDSKRKELLDKYLYSSRPHYNPI